MNENVENVKLAKAMRNPSVEVLRVILMLSIVFNHCAGQGAYEGDLLAWGLVVLTMYAVDTFAFISGWYSIRFSVGKMLRFYGLGAFCSIVLFAVSRFSLGYWHYNYSIGWFGNSYLGVMLLAPFINAGVERIPRHMLLRIWWAYLALLMFVWLPFQDFGISVIPVGWHSSSVNTLLFMYLTGRVAATSDWVKSKSVRFWGFAALGTWLATQTMVCGVHFIRVLGVVPERFLNVDGSSYVSPLTMSCAASLFMFFHGLRFPTVLGRVCAFLAPSLFGVYLLHSGCSKVVSATLIARFESQLVGLLPAGFLGMAINVAITAIIVFVVCALIDIMRRLMCQVFCKR